MHKDIIDFKVGETYTGVYICKSQVIRKTTNGKEYIDMKFIDKTGEISAKCWDIPVTYKPEKTIDGDFVALIMVIEEYQGKMQSKITNIKNIEPTDVFDKSEIVPTAPEKPEIMYSELINFISQINNSELRILCENVIEENKTLLMVCPGAKSMHHEVLSGLLQHLVGMLRLAKNISSLYPSVNTSLLYAGVILHDVRKLREFALSPIGLCSDYTKEGKLLGHITMGVSYIDKKCDELNISAEVRLLITHMILSHHGTPDFGSAKAPMFIEAILLNMIDNIDAKIYMCESALKGVEDNSFSDRIFGLDNIQLYKHTLPNY